MFGVNIRFIVCPSNGLAQPIQRQLSRLTHTVNVLLFVVRRESENIASISRKRVNPGPLPFSHSMKRAGW
jgi:hypothetical protein